MNRTRKPPPRQASQQRPADRLPHDPEAELWTVGAMLVDDAVVPRVLAMLNPADFADACAAAVMRAVKRLHDRGDPVDVRMILAEFGAPDDSRRREVRDYLTSVATTIPTSAHWRYHAQRVVDAAKRRKLLEHGEQLAARVADGDAPSEIGAELSDKLSALVQDEAPEANPIAVWHDSLSETEHRNEIAHSPVGSQLQRFVLGPEQLSVLGGLKGAGKSALAYQLGFNAMILDPDLRVLIACCEMSPSVILDRQVARLARVPHGAVRDRTYGGERRQAVYKAGEMLLSLSPRLSFLSPPFTMPRVRAVAASHRADLVIVDYVQRFNAGDAPADQRLQVSDVMSACRELAMTGPAVLTLSAMSRGGDFRDSSEIEYAVDSAFILEAVGNDADDPSRHDGPLVARCDKNRHGRRQDIELTFDGVYQEHIAAPEVEEWDVAG